MVSKLDQQNFTNEFDYHLMLHPYGAETHQSKNLKKLLKTIYRILTPFNNFLFDLRFYCTIIMHILICVYVCERERKTFLPIFLFILINFKDSMKENNAKTTYLRYAV